MTETDMKRIEKVDRPIVISGRIAAFVAICTLVLALGGGWTAAQVRIAVTENQVDTLAEFQSKNAARIDYNRDSIMRILGVIDRLDKWLDKQGED
jgi:hypothetical protein